MASIQKGDSGEREKGEGEMGSGAQQVWRHKEECILSARNGVWFNSERREIGGASIREMYHFPPESCL